MSKDMKLMQSKGFVEALYIDGELSSKVLLMAALLFWSKLGQENLESTFSTHWLTYEDEGVLEDRDYRFPQKLSEFSGKYK